MRPLVVALLVMTAACEAEQRVAVPDVELTSDEWPPAGPLPTAIPEDEPFDVRLVRLDPSTHEGQERVCDVAWAGRLVRLGAGARTAYPVPVSRRRLIRCRAATGEGWGDLIFDADSAALASYVETGDRIRVRVLPGRGFEGHPLLAFVAAIDHIELAPRREPVVPIGAPMEQLVRGGGTNQVHPCAIAYVGGIEPIAGAEEGAAEETHRVQIRCRHAAGADWLELRFPRVTAPSALRLRRGVVIPVRLLDADGGADGLPTARYEGP